MLTSSNGRSPEMDRRHSKRRSQTAGGTPGGAARVWCNLGRLSTSAVVSV